MSFSSCYIHMGRAPGYARSVSFSFRMRRSAYPLVSREKTKVNSAAKRKDSGLGSRIIWIYGVSVTRRMRWPITPPTPRPSRVPSTVVRTRSTAT